MLTDNDEFGPVDLSVFKGTKAAEEEVKSIKDRLKSSSGVPPDLAPAEISKPEARGIMRLMVKCRELLGAT